MLLQTVLTRQYLPVTIVEAQSALQPSPPQAGRTQALLLFTAQARLDTSHLELCTGT
jgi:hypothetical protein